MPRFLLLFLLLILPSCAANRYHAGRLELSLSPLPSLEVAALDGASEVAISRLPSVPSWGAESENVFLDELQRFQKAVRRLAKEPTAARYMDNYWLSFLNYVDKTLKSSLPLSVATLHRLRLTIEAEFQYVISEYGLPELKVLHTERLILNNIHDKLKKLALPVAKEKQLFLEWPVAVWRISSFFGYREDPFTGRITFHRGMDLAAPSGRIVCAAAPGKVVRAGWFRGHGQSVAIEHIGGYTTVYSHLSAIFVNSGEQLEEGSTVGLIGSTGRSTGPHLHFEVHYNGKAIDPLDIMEIPILLK